MMKYSTMMLGTRNVLFDHLTDSPASSSPPILASLSSSLASCRYKNCIVLNFVLTDRSQRRTFCSHGLQIVSFPVFLMLIVHSSVAVWQMYFLKIPNAQGTN